MTPPPIDPPSFALGFVACFCMIAYIVHLALRKPKP